MIQQQITQQLTPQLIILSWKQFVDINYDSKEPYIRYERVATTATGYGYGVWKPGEKRRDEGTVLIPYEYDRLIQYGSFYVAIKYPNGDKDDQILDIYNKDFVKTAENLEYNFYLYRTDPFGENIILPDGYFQIYFYDDDIDETVCGIIDANGEIIVPLLFYRAIRLCTYEGVGGKFVY